MSSVSSAVSPVTTNHSSSSYHHHHHHHHNASTNFSASYQLEAKENVRQALTAVYNPIYGAYPTSNIPNSIVPTAISSSFHGIYLSNGTSVNDDLNSSTGGHKAPSWPSPHSVTDLLSVGNSALSAVSGSSQPSPVTSSPSNATATGQFTPSIGSDSNGMLSAVAAVQQTSHYMQNYYMQLMHSHSHNPPPITSIVPSMTGFQWPGNILLCFTSLHPSIIGFIFCIIII